MLEYLFTTSKESLADLSLACLAGIGILSVAAGLCIVTDRLLGFVVNRVCDAIADRLRGCVRREVHEALAARDGGSA